MSTADKSDEEIRMWATRKLIKKLDTYKGNGTSMITIYVPQNYQI